MTKFIRVNTFIPENKPQLGRTSYVSPRLDSLTSATSTHIIPFYISMLIRGWISNVSIWYKWWGIIYHDDIFKCLHRTSSHFSWSTRNEKPPIQRQCTHNLWPSILVEKFHSAGLDPEWLVSLQHLWSYMWWPTSCEQNVSDSEDKVCAEGCKHLEFYQTGSSLSLVLTFPSQTQDFVSFHIFICYQYIYKCHGGRMCSYVFKLHVWGHNDEIYWICQTHILCIHRMEIMSLSLPPLWYEHHAILTTFFVQLHPPLAVCHCSNIIGIVDQLSGYCGSNTSVYTPHSFINGTCLLDSLALILSDNMYSHT
jgi:hypothetical protein